MSVLGIDRRNGEPAGFTSKTSCRIIPGLSDRGLIAEGKKADILLLDPETVRDTATYEEPAGRALGQTALG